VLCGRRAWPPQSGRRRSEARAGRDRVGVDQMSLMLKGLKGLGLAASWASHVERQRRRPSCSIRTWRRSAEQRGKPEGRLGVPYGSPCSRRAADARRRSGATPCTPLGCSTSTRTAR
jgi:hypothetical protein